MMIGNPTLDLQTDMSPASEAEKWLAEALLLELLAAGLLFLKSHSIPNSQ